VPLVFGAPILWESNGHYDRRDLVAAVREAAPHVPIFPNQEPKRAAPPPTMT
jgi:hypothetical protein